jgi:tetratricopeptide (TPR) repeat protein
MSLLMDALKRAERARQEEARRQAGSKNPRSMADTGGMSMDAPELSLEEMSSDDPLDIGEATLASTHGQADEDPLADLPEFRPSPADTIGLSDTAEMRAVEEEIASGRASLDANLEDTADWELGDLEQAMDTGDLRSSASLSMDYNAIPLDETGSTLPSMRAAQRSVDDYFDGTQSASMTSEQVGDVTGQTTGQVTGEVTDQRFVDTTRRTARALLEDGAPATRTRTGLVAAVVLIPLALLVLGGGAYLFQDELRGALFGEPRTLARPGPASRAAPSVADARRAEPAAAATPASGTGAATTGSASAPMQPVERAISEAAVAVPAPPAVPPSDAEQAAFVAAARALQADALDGAASGDRRAEGQLDASSAATVSGQIDTGVPVTAAATPATTPSPATGRDDGEPATASGGASGPGVDSIAVSEVLGGSDASLPGSVDLDRELERVGGGSGGLRITRRKGPSRTQRRLQDAYEAFNRGEDGTAAALYQRVLARKPDNRDALLGMGAIYMRGGAEARARAAYARVLRRNPRDTAALSGLVALQGNADPVSSEARIKTMLAERGPDAHLHFSLGNVFAQQRRWAEAQAAYFDAYRLANDNPDYAFNLAVALDQLRQASAATTYYRRALELAGGGRSIAFDPDAARSRISALGGAG